MDTSKNQKSEDQLNMDGPRSYASVAYCKDCHFIGVAQVKQEVSCKDCLCYCFCTCCWTFNKLCKNKDRNCFNAEHHCGNSKCGKLVGHYEAW
jgi:hypothetical protein